MVAAVADKGYNKLTRTRNAQSQIHYPILPYYGWVLSVAVLFHAGPPSTRSKTKVSVPPYGTQN